MLVNQVEVKNIRLRRVIPNRNVPVSKALCKACKLVSPQCLPILLPAPLPAKALFRVFLKSFFGLLYLVSPYPLVVDFWESHMSGLRDLVVWKQKATTDAPDTYRA
jgi:hypothetical protein